MNFDHVHLKALEQQIAGQKQTGRVSAAVSLLRILMAVFLILLAAGIFIFLLLTVLSCRRACEQFERIDL